MLGKEVSANGADNKMFLFFLSLIIKWAKPKVNMKSCHSSHQNRLIVFISFFLS